MQQIYKMVWKIPQIFVGAAILKTNVSYKQHYWEGMFAASIIRGGWLDLRYEEEGASYN